MMGLTLQEAGSSASYLTGMIAWEPPEIVTVVSLEVASPAASPMTTVVCTLTQICTPWLGTDSFPFTETRRRFSRERDMSDMSAKERETTGPLNLDMLGLD